MATVSFHLRRILGMKINQMYIIYGIRNGLKEFIAAIDNKQEAHNYLEVNFTNFGFEKYSIEKG